MPFSRTSTPEEGLRVYNLSPDSGTRTSYDARELGAQLLTTLELEHVLELFAHWVKKDLGQKSLVYRHHEQGVFFNAGVPSRHSLRYRLMLGETVLGELSLTRDERFSDEEIRYLERQIGGLVCALHNALRFREAENMGPSSERHLLRKTG